MKKENMLNMGMYFRLKGFDYRISSPGSGFQLSELH